MSNPSLWMLLLTIILMALSGLPAWLVLVTMATTFALGGVVAGNFSLSLFNALPLRLLGLLENDLLQALPLYVFIGTLLNRLPIVDVLFRAISSLLRRTHAAPWLAGIGIGTLLAPMNGTVGAGIAMLTRSVLPRLESQHADPERSAALVCAASVVGIVVPPSVVLLLLSDAMMKAHTEALNATARVDRVVNTQDIFHGALIPATILITLFLAVTWWRNRGIPATSETPAQLNRNDWILAGSCVALIVLLLGAVTLGYLYAVEAAATGGLAMFAFGVVTRSLNWPMLKAVLSDTLAISGALFALLVGATFYTLVLRAFNADLWMSELLQDLSGHGSAALYAVLLILMLSAFILDAIEITFVIVPLVMPSLLKFMPDATWISVLTLLVLQASFLLPPFGYSVLMVGSVSHQRLAMRTLARAIWPYLLMQAAVILLVLFFPKLVWHSS